MCLSGQALAVAEQLEEEKRTQQKFSELKVRLESVFTTLIILCSPKRIIFCSFLAPTLMACISTSGNGRKILI